MPVSNRRNGARSAVVDRALLVGLEQAASRGEDAGVELLLTAAQELQVTDLCAVLGLSVRSVLNACVRYALHCARAQGVPVQKLKTFPRHLEGRATTFQLAAETLGQLQEAEALDRVPGCAVAGIRLLYDRLLKLKKTK
jgi:hypothetical protein